MAKKYEPVSPKTNEVSKKVVGAAFSVHKKLGPGLLENVYELCLAHELVKQGIETKRQVGLPVLYDDVKIDAGFRLDLVVDGCLVVELKSVEALLPIHEAQVLTYLKLSGFRLGLLINFNVKFLKEGIKRIVL
jgi:GxxExxY protein